MPVASLRTSPAPPDPSKVPLADVTERVSKPVGTTPLHLP
jgi:hypothetical protein